MSKKKLFGLNNYAQNLAKETLDGANLRGSLFAHANLTDASLIKCDLTDSTFTYAKLVRANLAQTSYARKGKL